MASSIISAAQEIAKEFELSDDRLRKCVDFFIKQTEDGLKAKTDKGMPMIPTFVTAVPTGKEKGTFLAVDLGGTNVRVCSVKLNGDSTYELVQEKSVIPKKLMVGKQKEFFEHLAEKIEAFIEKHHSDEYTEDKPAEKGEAERKKIFKMGFTFSFPVDQTALNKGKLIRWTKGFDIKDAVGEDICTNFQAAINERGLPVHVAALVNDTVGTLMSRSYTKPLDGRTLVGCIFGTGTNGAYSEKIKAIPKFDIESHPEINDKIMIINTEWGSFDNELEVIPNNRFDKLVNLNTPNPGYHMFEKRISGMFLGELLRLVLLELKEKHGLFANQRESELLNTPWSIDTSVPATIDGDTTTELNATDVILTKSFGLSTNLNERKAIKVIARAIGTRSAFLSAIPIAGLVIHTKAIEKFEGEIDIGADGSVVEFYPNFEKNIRIALRKTSIGDNEQRITLGIAKDGSGVGAALCALVA